MAKNLKYGTFCCRYDLWYVNNKQKRVDNITYSYNDCRDVMFTEGLEEKRWKEIQQSLQEFWGKSKARIKITNKQITNVKTL